MRAGVLALLLAWGLQPAAWAEWRFGPATTVAEAQAGVFHHLESAGRKNLAIGRNGLVAVIWEDNRSGTPQVYVAFRSPGAPQFGKMVRVSTGEAAYEPVIVAVPHGPFVMAWEQDGRVFLRSGGPDGLGPAVALDNAESAQVSLAATLDGDAQAVWGRRMGAHQGVVTARIEVGPVLRAAPAVPVETERPPHDQLYPTVAVTEGGVVVAWEDRRHGHTRLYYSHSLDGVRFARPAPLNELPPARSAVFGRGTGVTRVALSAGRSQRVVALWMDKRDFEGGYKVYGALSRDGGRSFGPNEKVQDAFGDNTPQWHPAVGMGRGGEAVAVWDDARDETADIWLSWRQAEGWSEDAPVGPAAGPGEQSDPVLVVDGDGRVHIAWLSREEPNGPTRIQYAVGEKVEHPE